MPSNIQIIEGSTPSPLPPSGSLTLFAQSGDTLAYVNSAGTVTPLTGGGGGGTPGGSSGDIQINNSGAFGTAGATNHFNYSTDSSWDIITLPFSSGLAGSKLLFPQGGAYIGGTSSEFLIQSGGAYMQLQGGGASLGFGSSQLDLSGGYTTMLVTGSGTPNPSIVLYTGTSINFNSGSLLDNTNSPGNAGQVLQSTGSQQVVWATPSGGAPGGSTGDIQINNSGTFGTGTPGLFTISGAYLTLNTGAIVLVESGGTIAFEPGGELYLYGAVNDYSSSSGTLGQYLSATGSSTVLWENVIAKQVITTTGTDTIANSVSPTIYAVLVGAQATESLTFPSAGFDGQVLTINAADAQTALTMTPAGADIIKNPLTTMVAGQSVTFIYNLATTTWY